MKILKFGLPNCTPWVVEPEPKEKVNLEKQLLSKIDELSIPQLMLLAKYTFYRLRDLEEAPKKRKMAEALLCELNIKKFRLQDSDKEGWFKVEDDCN